MEQLFSSILALYDRTDFLYDSVSNDQLDFMTNSSSERSSHIGR